MKTVADKQLVYKGMRGLVMVLVGHEVSIS